MGSPEPVGRVRAEDIHEEMPRADLALVPGAASPFLRDTAAVLGTDGRQAVDTGVL